MSDKTKATEAKQNIDHYGREKLPTFSDIREWSWDYDGLNGYCGSIEQAAKHFKAPTSMIKNLIDETEDYPYFGYAGEGIDGSLMPFWHDGE